VSPRGRTQKGKIGTLTLENEKLTLKDTHCPDSLPHSRKEHSQGLNNNAVVLSLVQRNFQRLVPFLFALGPRGDTIRSDTHCPDSLPHSRKEHSQGLNNNAVVLSLVQRNFQRLVPFLFALGPRGDTIRSGTRAHCADHFSHRRQDIKLVTFTSSLAGALVKT
jgi:predicted transcriptional regulator